MRAFISLLDAVMKLHESAGARSLARSRAFSARS
jgi:hypothetical protein